MHSYLYRLGVIGGGNMAEALVRAAIAGRVLQPSNVIVSEPSEERRTIFDTLGIATTTDTPQLIRETQQVLLSVKPQVFPKLADALATMEASKQVVISIMAGVRIERIAAACGAGEGGGRVIRVMPNTPAMVGKGMAGVALSPNATEADAGLTLQLLRAAGEAVLVDEAKLDAITAVSGSGPAYLFYLAEAMQQAARELGLSEHAELLVNQTLAGAAAMLQAPEAPSPEELRRRVTSPGGTTQAAIDHLDGNSSKDVIVNAIKAAEARSRELAETDG